MVSEWPQVWSIRLELAGPAAAAAAATRVLSDEGERIGHETDEDTRLLWEYKPLVEHRQGWIEWNCHGRWWINVPIVSRWNLLIILGEYHAITATADARIAQYTNYNTKYNTEHCPDKTRVCICSGKMPFKIATPILKYSLSTYRLSAATDWKQRKRSIDFRNCVICLNVPKYSVREEESLKD